MADSIAMDNGFLKTDTGEGYAFFGPGYSTPKYHGDGARIGMRQSDTAMRDQFTAAISAIRANGTYAEINAKYFDFDIYGG